MADPVEPTPAEAAEPSSPLLAQPSEDDVLAAMQALAEATKTTETDDFTMAFAPENGEDWLIPTGRFDAEGHQISLRVKVKDPKRPELPTQYMQAIQVAGEAKAAIGLWQACIVEPKALKNPANYDKTTTSFRATLTQRLLVMVGVNGDFLQASMAMNTISRPTVTKLSPTLPPASASIPAPSSTSTPSNSAPPTSKPVESVHAIAPSL